MQCWFGGSKHSPLRNICENISQFPIIKKNISLIQSTRRLRWTGDGSIPFHCDGLFVPESWQDQLEPFVVLSGDDWNCLSELETELKLG